MVSDDVDQLIYEISGRTGPTSGRGRSISEGEGYIFIYSFFASLARFFSNRLLLRSVEIYEYAPPPPPPPIIDLPQKLDRVLSSRKVSYDQNDGKACAVWNTKHC